MEPAGRTAIVTGGGSGIGRAIAVTLARAGARVGLLGRRPEPLQRVAAEIAAEDGEAFPAPCDLLDDRQTAHAVRMVQSALGPVEILVNNAGMAHSAPLRKIDDDTWERLMKLNVRAPYMLCGLVRGDMEKGSFGRVVNIASVAAFQGWKYTALYTASKHALASLTRRLAHELRDHGITVNMVCPGYVDTPIVESAVRVIADKTNLSPDEARASLAAMNPLGRLVRPEEVAAAVLYFVGEGSAAVSAHGLVVDGGSVSR